MKLDLDKPVERRFTQKQLLGALALSMGVGMALMFLFSDWIIMATGITILALLFKGFRKFVPEAGNPLDMRLYKEGKNRKGKN